MKYKTCTAFKAAAKDAADVGEFEAIVSVFNNIDYAGDVVVPGAFTETLAEWAAKGDPIPVLWSHRMDDPRFAIGSVVDAAELAPGDERIPKWADPWVKDNGGLWVKGRIDVGAEASDVGLAARKLMLSRRVTQFSYAYDVIDSGFATRDGEEVYELRRLKVYEVSPTLVGCNSLTELVGAKAAGLIARGTADADPDMVRRLLADVRTADIEHALSVLRTAKTQRDGDNAGTTKREEPEPPVKREESTRAESVRLSIDLATATAFGDVED